MDSFKVFHLLLQYRLLIENELKLYKLQWSVILCCVCVKYATARMHYYCRTLIATIIGFVCTLNTQYYLIIDLYVKIHFHNRYTKSMTKKTAADDSVQYEWMKVGDLLSIYSQLLYFMIIMQSFFSIHRQSDREKSKSSGKYKLGSNIPSWTHFWCNQWF